SFSKVSIRSLEIIGLATVIVTPYNGSALSARMTEYTNFLTPPWLFLPGIGFSPAGKKMPRPKPGQVLYQIKFFSCGSLRAGTCLAQ
ncbi:MAG: hypothetical protein WCC11_01905, partial [Gammaproteobacteria bacterium]